MSDPVDGRVNPPASGKGLMDSWVDRITSTLGIVLVILDFCAIGLLGAALLRRRREVFAGRTWQSLAVVPVGVVVGVLGVAVILALVFGVPSPLPWLTAGALLLILLVRLPDRAFWTGLAALLGVFSGFGLLLIVSLGVTFSNDDGNAFYGVTRLTELGGPDLNPAYAWWWLPLIATAVLKFGLPMAMTITLSWLVATRASLTWVERLAFVLVLARFGLLVFDAPVYSLVYLLGGPLVGLPDWRFAIGIVPAVAIFLLLGSGGAAGLFTGGRAVLGGVPLARAVSEGLTAWRGLLAALGRPHGDAALDDRPLVVYIGELARGGKRGLVRLGVVTLVPALLVGVSVLISPPLPSRQLDPEHLAEEIDLHAMVTEVAYPGGDDVWLRQDDGGVQRVALADGGATRVPIEVSDLTTSGGQVFALVPGSPARVVELAGDSARDVVTLGNDLTGVLAVTTETVYIGLDDGRLFSVDRRTGARGIAVDTGQPVTKVMVGQGAVWTVHALAEPNAAQGRYVAARRDPATLAPAGEQPPDLLLNDLVIQEDGPGWIEIDSTVAPYPFTRAAPRPARQPVIDPELAEYLPGLGTMAGGETGTVHPGRDSRSAWAAFPYGRLTHVAEGGNRRVDLPYDSVDGVVETETATWFVVSRRDRLLGAVPTTTRSFLVRRED